MFSGRHPRTLGFTSVFLTFLLFSSLLLPCLHLVDNRQISAGSRADEPTTFTDEAADSGLEGVSMSNVAWGDYNGDGYQDLLLNGKRLFRCDGPPSWGFTEVLATESGITAPCYSGIFADYDNDGDLDLFTTSSKGNRADCLWRNEGDGSFFNATTESGISDSYETVATAWGDYNGDGYVDLYIGNYEDPDNMEARPDYLWKNNGDGSFSDVSNEAGIRAEEDQCTRGVAWADYDNDGDLDIYVANYRLDRNYLWENNGDGGFNEVAQDKGVEGEEDDEGQGNYGHSIGVSWGDYDNDGDLDMFVANLAHNNDPYRGPLCDNSKLYRNDGAGAGYSFTNVIDEAGIENKDFPHDEDQLYSGPAWGDYDNDGDLDLYITQIYADISYAYSYLYRNNDNGTFTDVAVAAGVRVWDAWAVSWCDYDQDGNLDLLVGGRDGSDSGENPKRVHLFRNNGESRNNWLTIDLKVGEGFETDINREAIGTRVKVIPNSGDVQIRELEGGTGTCATMNSFELEFGFDDYDGTVDVEVMWYQQDTITLEGVELNQRLQIHYGGAVAAIEEITPNPATTEDDISFRGGGYAKGGISQYSWRSSLDGDLYTGPEAEFTTTDQGLTLSPGKHEVYLKVQDENEEWSSEARGDLKVTVPGNVAPELELFSPSGDGVVTKLAAYFYWQGFDENEEEISYDFYLDTDENPKILVAGGLTQERYRATGLENDTIYYWKVVATDESAESVESPVRSFHVNDSADNTAPEIELLTPYRNGKCLVLDVSLTWKAWDANGDELEFTVYCDETSDPQTVVVSDHQDFSCLVDCQDQTRYYWKAVCSDGLEEVGSEVWQFTLSQNEPPTVTLLSPDDKEISHDAEITLKWEAEDAEEDDLTFDVYFGTDTEPGLLKEDLEDTELDVEELVDGEVYYWKVFCQDGTSETESETWSFTVDISGTVNEKPELEITSLENGDTVTGVVKIKGTAFDPDGIIQFVEWRVDDGSWKQATDTESWTFIWDTVSDKLEDGEYALQVRAFDGILYSDEETMTLTLENGPPPGDSGKGGGDDDDFEIAGQDGYLVLGGAAVAVVTALGLAFYLKRRADYDYDEDEDYYEDSYDQDEDYYQDDY